MSKITRLSSHPKRRYVPFSTTRIDCGPFTDKEQRIKATKALARESWHVVLWPFAPFGALFYGWVGLGIGVGIGLALYVVLLCTMRYGREL